MTAADDPPGAEEDAGEPGAAIRATMRSDTRAAGGAARAATAKRSLGKKVRADGLAHPFPTGKDGWHGDARPVAAPGWQAIQADVLARIRSRDWPPGAMIPNEAELARDYGCARATVNRALRELAGAGYLDRRRKAGTRVALNPVRRATLAIPVTRLEVEARGMEYAHLVLSRRRGRAGAELARRMGAAEGAAILRLCSLHLADRAPWLYEERVVFVDGVPAILQADLGAVSANEWLVQNAPFSRGSFRISAISAGPQAAEALACAPGAALVAIDRATWNGEAPVTEVRLIYAPGYSLSSAL